MTEIDEIERDLSESRASLKNNVSALSDKLTLGRVVDDLLADSKINWDQMGDKAGHTLKSAVPGAVIGAGLAMLLANGALSNFTAHSWSKKTRYHDGFNPLDDWRTDAQYQAIESFERDAPRVSGEDDNIYHGRQLDHYARSLGHQRLDGEDEHKFKDRIEGAVDQLKRAAAGARDRLKAAAEQSAEGAGAALGDAKDGLKSFASSVQNKAGAAAYAGKDGVHDGIVKLQAMFDKNPAIGMAVGLGIGALLGAVIPITHQEEEVLREPVKKATIAAAEIANQISDKATEKLGAGIDAVKDVASNSIRS